MSSGQCCQAAELCLPAVSRQHAAVKQDQPLRWQWDPKQICAPPDPKNILHSRGVQAHHDKINKKHKDPLEYLMTCPQCDAGTLRYKPQTGQQNRMMFL